ncbi:MAG TPA: phosphoribosylformylglycinamidine synthase subunit PurL [Bryobacterales bacterium]|nr:phosphoribosylformylglycinamidine synthase subunit PurL [Bryobacterales bacterium]
MSTINTQLIEQHGLTSGEYDRIVEKLGREPTLTELGIISVMWSEHCSYKSSRIHLKKLPTEGARILVGPGENAGIVDIGNGYAAAFKIESHNHPSFIEPFQGAATGVGGILRDIFTMGARPLAVMDSLRFGPPDDAEAGSRNRHIVRGVVGGIAHYGNCFGVPTIGGECLFESSYNGNPLVNAYALGIFRKDRIFFGKACGLGNPVIYVGAKTGRDGIHGASMASAEFDEQSEQKRPNVQVGDPFLEKLLMEACLEAMDQGVILGIQDMGAAGLTCSTCEMGGRGGTGIEIDLRHVPQREQGMTPYEIMLSESQERMLLVAERGVEEKVFSVFKKWGLDAVEIGTVTGDGILRVRDHGEIVAEVPNSLLTDDAPLYNRPSAAPYRPAPLEGPAVPTPSGGQMSAALELILGSPDLCSKRAIYEQYDYMVRTNTTLPPGSDAAVIRIKEAGVSLAMALDGNGRYCALDPREGAKLAVAECCRNLSTVGAEPIAATNCLNFGNPEKPEIMGQFIEAVEGMGEACRFFGTPITGGNVSLYNETLGDAIYPTPVIGIVGLIDHMDPPAGSHFRAAGRKIVLIGGLLPGVSADLADLERRFGSTQYAKVILGRTWGLPPALDMGYEKRVHEVVRAIVRQGLAESVHDLSEGGLAVGLARCGFGPERIAARVEVKCDCPSHFGAFHEAPSRVLLSVADENIEAVSRIAAGQAIPAPVIGVTQPGDLHVQINGDTIHASIHELHETWDSALERMLIA